MGSFLAIDGGPEAITLEQDESLKWPLLGPEEEAAVVRLIRKNEISVSDEPVKFEKEFAEYLGADYALAEVNGTAALYAALFAIGLKPGDQVICPSYTYWASAMPAVSFGAEIVFCEVQADSYNLDPEDFRNKITDKTKAVIPVHLWGNPCDMDAINEIAGKNNIYVIEDACHAHGAEYKGKKAGTLGDIGIFSFQASKNLPAGEGGMLVTANSEFYKKSVVLGHYRRAGELPPEYSRYRHTSFGFKHRMSPLHAAIGRVQLGKLERMNAVRSKNIGKLLNFLQEQPGFRIYQPPEGVKRVFYENDITYMGEETGVPMDRLIEMLQAEGARVRRDRYPLLHQQPFFTEKGYNPDDLPVTRHINEHVLALPTFPHENDALVEQYIEAFSKVIRSF